MHIQNINICINIYACHVSCAHANVYIYANMYECTCIYKNCEILV